MNWQMANLRFAKTKPLPLGVLNLNHVFLPRGQKPEVAPEPPETV